MLNDPKGFTGVFSRFSTVIGGRKQIKSESDERISTTGYAAKPDSYFYSNVDMDLLQEKIRQAGAKPNYRAIMLQLTKEKDLTKKAKLERYIPPVR
ncbi:MAG: hypothetical protein RLZZ422_295 [Pseudomonadota bacterium]